MPKTKDAFALADFDAERILQRPFFKTLCLPEASDDEILFGYGDYRTAQVMSAEEFVNLRGLQRLLAAYTKKLLSHDLRLEKLMRRYSELYVQTSAQIYKDKYNRAYLLQQSYRIANEFNTTLQRHSYLIEQDVLEIFKLKFRKSFGERLRQARKKAGLSQSELAARVGLKTYNPVTQYERGINDPSTPTLYRLAKELECSADWLLGLK